MTRDGEGGVGAGIGRGMSFGSMVTLAESKVILLTESLSSMLVVGSSPSHKAASGGGVSAGVAPVDRDPKSVFSEGALEEELVLVISSTASPICALRYLFHCYQYPLP